MMDGQRLAEAQNQGKAERMILRAREGLGQCPRTLGCPGRVSMKMTLGRCSEQSWRNSEEKSHCKVQMEQQPCRTGTGPQNKAGDMIEWLKSTQCTNEETRVQIPRTHTNAGWVGSPPVISASAPRASSLKIPGTRPQKSKVEKQSRKSLSICLGPSYLHAHMHT